MIDNDDDKCELISRKLRYSGKAFEVFEYTTRVGDRKIKRDIIERRNGVVAVPIDKDKNVYMLSEFCAGSNGFVLSLPGGKAKSKNESRLATEAQRELREETGYRAAKIIKLRFAWSHPSTSSQRSYVFLAYDLIHDPLPKGEDEIIKLVVLPLDVAIERSYRDFQSDVSTVGNLLMARDKIRELGL